MSGQDFKDKNGAARRPSTPPPRPLEERAAKRPAAVRPSTPPPKKS